MTTDTMETTTISEKAAQEEIRDVVRDLEALRFRLVGVRASLPGSAEEEEDAAVDLRAVLDCVLADSIGPALRDLRKLVDEGC
jgi:chloramphenicol 3-O-phosphotransferase